MDRSGRLGVLREPKIISLVFDVFICMLLLVVQDRTESKICGMSGCQETLQGLVVVMPGTRSLETGKRAVSEE